MRVDVSGVVTGQPSMKGKSASFKLKGGGPFLYAYGAFGEQLLSNIAEGTHIMATGSVNYAKDGNGNWEKYINLVGGATILPNKISGEDEKAKLTFVASGRLTNITPQQVKSGNMAKFTIEETSVDFRGSNALKHSMVAFEDAAEVVLALAEGESVMVAGTVNRVKGRDDNWYTSFTATKVLPVSVSASAPSPQAPSQPQSVDEDDLPF